MGKNAQRRHRPNETSPITYRIGLTLGNSSPVFICFEDAATGRERLVTTWTPEAADAIGMALLNTARMARSWATNGPVVPAGHPEGNRLHLTAKGPGGAATELSPT